MRLNQWYPAAVRRRAPRPRVTGVTHRLKLLKNYAPIDLPVFDTRVTLKYVSGWR